MRLLVKIVNEDGQVVELGSIRFEKGKLRSDVPDNEFVQELLHRPVRDRKTGAQVFPQKEPERAFKLMPDHYQGSRMWIEKIED